MAPRLIVTDLDGTLLLPDKSVSARNLAAIRAAQQAGITVIAATGRSVVDMPLVLPPEIGDLVICSNGAVVYNATRDEVLLERTVSGDVIRALVEALLPQVPGTAFATLVNSGYDLLAGPGYLDLMAPGDHGRDRDRLTTSALDALFATPAVKLIARHDEVPLAELFEACERLAHVGVLPTTSGVPFIEMSATGVSKATTLALLTADWGINVTDVVVFGDSANDVEMLGWAGHGVAMGNAAPAVQSVADEVAPSNGDDGVAVVIERLLGQSGSAS